jgi:D-alanyl-D-alanine carboxypeptidase
MTRSFLISLLFALVACGGATPAAPPKPEAKPLSAADARLAAELDAVVAKAIEGQPMAGVSVVVTRGDATILAKGYGLADVEAKRAAAADTIYRIGSVTKSFTAAMILALDSAGELRIDDPLSVYLPHYDAHGKTITLRHLLTHTSGIKGYTELDAFGARMAEAFPRDELVAMFEAEPLMFEPGTRWSYSNSGYYLLGLVIEKVTGKPYADAVRELAIQPAGLVDTSYCPQQMTTERQARPYAVKDGAVVPAAPLDMEHPYAAGSLCSTAVDLARWIRALASGRVVNATTWPQMITPVTLNDGTSFPYGFGLQTGPLGDHPKIGHGGGINGFISAMDMFPADELVIVVLTNSETELAPQISKQLAQAVLKIEEKPVADLPLDAATATAYVGRYDFPEIGLKLEVKYEDGKLQTANLDAQGKPLGWLPVRSQGDHVFAAPEVGATLTFLVEGEHAVALEVDQGGARFRGALVP